MKKQLTTPKTLPHIKWWESLLKKDAEKLISDYFPNEGMDLESVTSDEIEAMYLNETPTPQTVSNSIEDKYKYSQEAALANYNIQAVGFTPYRRGFGDGWDKCLAVNNYQRLLDSNAELLEALELVLNSLDTFGESNSWEMTDTIAWTKGNEILKKYKP